MPQHIKLSRIKDAIVLMRIPFSLYLMPVFWFALSCSENIDFFISIYVFLILHVLVYPASNGYNSYYDKDEGSTGGLKNPPKPPPELLYLVFFFDVLSVIFSLMIHPSFGIMVFTYLMISKAYSHPAFRWKKMPFTSALVIFLFQGAFTFFMVQKAIGLTDDFMFSQENILYALVSSLFLLGSYPVTQIYQHDEDAQRGDITLSMLLGIKGTFRFSAIAFTVASLLLCYVYYMDEKVINAYIYVLFTVPVLYFFFKWMVNVSKNASAANFENTMFMNKISSLCLSAAFIIILLLNY